MNEKKKNNFFVLCVMFLGFFSTTPILTIPLGRRDIAVFRMFFYGILLYLIIMTLSKKSIEINKNLALFDCWILEGTVSCVIGWVLLAYSAPEFSMNAFSYIPKSLAFLLFALVWGNQKKETIEEANQKLLQGILYGCVANLIWAVIDGVDYYVFGKSLNNALFSGYIARHHIRYGMLSLITNSGLFRASGFNSDPAQIGFIAPLVIGYAFYKKQYWLLVVAVLGILTSASTTALVSSVIIIVIFFFSKKQKNLVGSKRKYSIAICCIGLALIIWIMFGEQINILISTASSRFFERLNTVYFEPDADSSIRWKYFCLAPIALLNLNVKGLFGLGFGTASYGYVIDDYILSVIGQGKKFAFDPENTYISYLLDTGIVGFLIFLMFTMKLILFYKNKIKYKYNETELIVYVGILSTALSMFFYHYILFTPQVLITIIGLSIIDKEQNYL